MKALVKNKPGPGIALLDVPDPVPGAGEVLVQVRACGIGGSEIGRYLWDENYSVGGPKDMSASLPRIIGTEFSGEVAGVGKGVVMPKVGERVVVNNIVGCGQCDQCLRGATGLCVSRVTIGVDRDGGFAEYAVVPAGNVMIVSESLSFDIGALIQPFSIGTHAVEISGVRAGDRVGIWGAGVVGLSVLANVILAGAEVVFMVGRGRPRLDAARRLGAPRTFSVSEGEIVPRLKEEIAPKSLDVVFDAAGSADVFTAAPFLRSGGGFVLVGNFRGPVTLDLVSLRRREISLLSVRSFTLQAWRRAARLIDRSGLHEVIGPAFPISRGEEAFRLSADGTVVKAIIRPNWVPG